MCCCAATVDGLRLCSTSLLVHMRIMVHVLVTLHEDRLLYIVQRCNVKV